jgi:hypothetical protein
VGGSPERSDSTPTNGRGDAVLDADPTFGCLDRIGKLITELRVEQVLRQD